jgi:hypothetical protein
MFECNINKMKIFLTENQSYIQKKMGIRYHIHHTCSEPIITSIAKKTFMYNIIVINNLSDDEYNIIKKIFYFVRYSDIPNQTKRNYYMREVELFFKQLENKFNFTNDTLSIDKIFYIFLSKISKYYSEIEEKTIFTFDELKNKCVMKEVLIRFKKIYKIIVFFNEFKILSSTSCKFKMNKFQKKYKEINEKYKINNEKILNCKILSEKLPIDICKYVLYQYL